MKNVLLIPLIVLAIACENNATNSSDGFKDGALSDRKTLAQVKDSSIPENHLIRKQIIGIWASPGEDNSSFKIEKDSIYYTELFSRYHYTVNNDSLIVWYDDFVETFYIRTKGNDTLVLTGREEQLYYRFAK